MFGTLGSPTAARRRPAPLRRSNRSLRPHLERLEDLCLLSVGPPYTPQFGAPTITQRGSDVITGNIPVYLIYAGGPNASYGSDPGHPVSSSTITQAVQQILASNYLSGLSEYGAATHAYVAGTYTSGESLPTTFTDVNINTIVTHSTVLWDGPLPAPNNSDSNPNAVYFVFTPRGYNPSTSEHPGGYAGIHLYGTFFPRNFILGRLLNVGAYGVVTSTPVPVQAPYQSGTQLTPLSNPIDSITTIFSHELVEMFTDPQGGSGIVVSPGSRFLPNMPAYQGPDAEIADNEAQYYAGYLGNVAVQSYWSAASGRFVTPGATQLRQPIIVLNRSSLLYNGQQAIADATISPWVPGDVITPGTTLEGVGLTLTYYAGTTTTGTPLSGPPVTAGTYTVEASFAGSTNYSPTTSKTTFTIGQATPTITVLASDRLYLGQPAVADATLAGVVTGVDDTPGDAIEGVAPTFLYYSGPTATGTPLDAPPVSAGTYTVVATFAGSPDYTAATAQATFTIGQATPVLTLASQDAPYNGQPYPPIATLAGVVPGVDDEPADVLEQVPLTLVYFAGNSATGTPLDAPPVDPGIYTVVAAFAGSTNYTSARSTTTFTITPASPTIQWIPPASIVYGTPLDATQLNATALDVNGNPLSGTFTYTPDVGTVLNVGAGQSLSVTFTPDDATDYTTATATVTIDVKPPVPIPTVSLLAASANPSPAGQAVTFVAVVAVTGSAAPTGTVRFMFGRMPIDVPVTVINGWHVGVFTTAPLPVGNYPVTAYYQGALGFLPSTSNTIIERVVPAYAAPTTTLLASTANPSPAGQPVSLVATVTAANGATPSGTVRFLFGSLPFDAPLQTINGLRVAVLTTAPLPAGNFPVTAVYLGATGFRSSNSQTLVQRVTASASVATSTALIPAANPVVAGQPLTLIAMVSAANGTAPTGTVRFSVNNVTYDVPLQRINGLQVAVLSTSAKPVGNYTVSALYLGAAGYRTSTSQSVNVSVVSSGSTLASFGLAYSKTQRGQARSVISR